MHSRTLSPLNRIRFTDRIDFNTSLSEQPGCCNTFYSISDIISLKLRIIGTQPMASVYLSHIGIILARNPHRRLCA